MLSFPKSCLTHVYRLQTWFSHSREKNSILRTAQEVMNS